MFYLEERKLHHKLQLRMELRVPPPLLLEYEAELPPFPEGYKIKPEAVITVSIAPPQLK